MACEFFWYPTGGNSRLRNEYVYGATTRSVSFYIYSSLRTPNSKFKSRYYADMSQLLALKKIPHSLQSWLKLTSLVCVIYWVSTGVRGQVPGRKNSSILNQLQLSVEKRKFEFAANGNWKFLAALLDCSTIVERKYLRPHQLIDSKKKK